MKLVKTTKLVALAAIAIASATSVKAVTVGSEHLLGTINPGTPADPTNEAAMANFLISAYNTNPAPRSLGDNPLDPQPESYTLAPGSSIPAGPLPAVTLVGYHDVSPTSDPNFNNASGYDWIVAKYGQDAEVFYIGDLTGDVTLSNLTGNRNGLSGYTLYNRGTVPDGGATAALFSIGMVSVALLRRKQS